MTRLVGRPKEGSGCKECKKPHVLNSTMRFCLTHLRKYWRTAQRAHRGWIYFRWHDPIEADRRKKIYRLCGDPRQDQYLALCIPCAVLYRRARERKHRGWPESRLMEPSVVVSNLRCAKCGDPRYSGPDKEKRRHARCLSCLHEDQRVANQRMKAKREKEG